MARRPDKAVLEDLKKKRELLDQEIRDQEQKVKEREREKEEERLKAYGVLVDTEIKQGLRDLNQVMNQLNPLLKFNKQRAAVGLPLIGLGSKNQKTDGQKDSLSFEEDSENESRSRKAEHEDLKDNQKPKSGNFKAKSERGGAKSNQSAKTEETRGKHRSALFPEDSDAELAAHFNN